MTSPPSADLRAQFGDIDIYLFDQLLRRRSAHAARPYTRLGGRLLDPLKLA